LRRKRRAFIGPALFLCRPVLDPACRCCGRGIGLDRIGLDRIGLDRIGLDRMAAADLVLCRRSDPAAIG
jgi:hypothetical protein